MSHRDAYCHACFPLHSMFNYIHGSLGKKLFHADIPHTFPYFPSGLVVVPRLHPWQVLTPYVLSSQTQTFLQGGHEEVPA